MCILVVCEPGTIPTREELVMGSCANPHGFGYAVSSEGELIVNRAMEADALIDEFLEVRKANIDEYAIYHARYASHGSVDLDNCHPFYLGEDKKTVMAHNGNIPNSLQAKDDTRSDSRWFAEEIMPSIGGVEALDNPVLSEMMGKWLTSNRVAFLTVHPKAKYNLYLFGEGHGSVDLDGVWWSNDYHRRPEYAEGASSHFGKEATELALAERAELEY